MALPGAWLVGSSLARACRQLDLKALVPVPAVWDVQKRRWTVELLFDVRPEPVPPVGLHKHAKSKRELHDVSSGLDAVTLNITILVWKQVGSSKKFNSPVPAVLIDTKKKGAPPTTTEELLTYLVEVDTWMDLPRYTASRSLDGDSRKTSAFRRKKKASLKSQKETLLKGENFVLARPAVLPDILALDEIYLHHEYWTVLSDNTDSPSAGGLQTFGQRVLGLCKGRDVPDLTPMLGEVAGWYRENRRKGPGCITADMREEFRLAVHETFGPDQFFSADRFHIEMRVRAGWRNVITACLGNLRPEIRAAVEACKGSPCTCQQGAVCQRYRRATALHTHIKGLWKIEDIDELKKFRKKWQRLYEVPCAGLDGRHRDFANVATLFSGRSWNPTSSQWRMLVQTFVIPYGEKRPSNARAEALNALIRRVLRFMNRRDPNLILGELLNRLHTVPVRKDPQLVQMPPEILKCPSCKKAVTLPRRPEYAEVVGLPRGLTPLSFRVPVQVICEDCGKQPYASGPVAPELQWWLQAPLQFAPAATAISRLTGLSEADVMQFRGDPVAGKLPVASARVVLYDEIWTGKRVWLTLSTPDGDLLDVSAVTKSSVVMDVHQHVAARALQFLKRNEPPEGYERIVMYKKYQVLSRHLSAASWKNTELHFTLPPYQAHELRVRFQHRALRMLAGHNFGSPKDLNKLLKLPVTGWLAHPQWLTLRAAYPETARALQETRILEHLLRDEFETVIRWVRTVRGKTVPTRAEVIEHFFELGPRQDDTSNPADPDGSALRIDQWKAWWATRRWLQRTMTSAPVNTPYQPQMVSDIKHLLRSSPSMSISKQRHRVLVVLAAEKALRA